MDMVRFLSHECLRQAYERNVVSFESNLLNSPTIVVIWIKPTQLPYDRSVRQKNIVAFYGPIFASCTSVPITYAN